MFDALEDYAGNETLIYAVADGRLFHKKDCDYIKNVTDPIELTVSQAMGNNLTSCQKCNPISNNISNRDDYLILLLPTADNKILPAINVFRDLWGYELEPSTSAIVYITPSGTKYHRNNCYHLDDAEENGTLITMTKQEAKDQGYTSCFFCTP